MLLAVSGPAWGLPRPMTLSQTFADLPPTRLDLPAKAPACPVSIVSLEDRRRSPDMIGVLQGRQIFAPQDRKAWLESILNALGSRGLTIAPGNVIGLDVELTTAWITETNVNVSASTVFRVIARQGGETAFDRSFRGGASHMTYWSNGPSTIQPTFDAALSRVLDDMATGIRGLCSGETPAVPAP